MRQRGNARAIEAGARRFRWLFLVACLFSLKACTASQATSDKNTNWLGACTQTSECRDGLECIHRICTQACVARDGCLHLSENAVCAAPSRSDSCLAPSPSVCTLPCTGGTSCPSTGDLVCRADVCFPNACAEAGAPIDDASADGAPLPPSTSDASQDGAPPGADGGGRTTTDGAAEAATDGGNGGTTVTPPVPDDGRVPVDVVAPASLTRIPLSAQALAPDPVRPRFYALAAADDSAHPNELVTLDATSGAVIDSTPVGAAPTAIAATPDGSTLWIGSNVSYDIRQVDLTGSTPVLRGTYTLPAEWNANSSLVVIPPHGAASPTLLRLRKAESGTFVGEVSLSGSAALPGRTGSFASQVTSGPPGYFFAYDDWSSGFFFSTVDARAENFVDTPYIYRIRGYGRDLAYDPDGFVFASSGEVVDVRTPGTPRRAGTFPVSGAVVPVPGSDLAFMLSNAVGTTVPVVHVLDSRTFSRLRTLEVSQGISATHSPVRVGTDRLAFAGTEFLGKSVYLLNTAQSVDSAKERVAPVVRGDTLQLPYAARALVADPLRNVLYVAVGAASERAPNRLLTLDPETGNVVNSVDIGSNPEALGLSSDGSALWVSLTGASSLRRVDLTSGTLVPGPHLDLSIPVGSPSVFPFPGNSRSVAAVIGENGSNSGIAYYDDGVLRPGLFPGDVDPNFAATELVAGPPALLFGINCGGGATGAFCTVAYDGADAPRRQVHSVSFSAWATHISYDPDGFLYGTSGDVFDVRDPWAPVVAGTFTLTDPAATSAVLPFPGPKAVLVAGGDQMRELDARTFTVGRTRGLDCGGPGTVKNLVRAGPSRVAFVVEGALPQYSRVCIVNDPELIP